jgi:hypothetical protein
MMENRSNTTRSAAIMAETEVDINRFARQQVVFGVAAGFSLLKKGAK